jgi:hypothetical protein
VEKCNPAPCARAPAVMAAAPWLGGLEP